MGLFVHNSPVNPAQVVAALPGAEGCTVRQNGDAWEVEAEGVTDEALEAAVGSIVYDESVGVTPTTEELLEQALARIEALEQQVLGL